MPNPKPKAPKPPITPPLAHLVPLDQILVTDRFRVNYDGPKSTQTIEHLAESINKFGLLEFPVVDGDTNTLLAGGRRLAAVRKLGWTEVPVLFKKDLDPTSRLEIELEENIARKDLDWAEEARLTRAIFELKLTKYGRAPTGPRHNTTLEERGWSREKQAEYQNVTKPIIYQNLRLANALEAVPSLANETSRANALRKVDRLEEDIIRELDQRKRKQELTQFTSDVLCGDATSLILQIATGSVDCIITDPPYGVDVGVSGGHRMRAGFDDSPEGALAVLRSIAPECRRVLKPSGHLYTFFPVNFWREHIEIWRAAGFDVREIPNIWAKPGGSTGTADWDHNYAAQWEPFLFASNREQRLNFKRSNVFNYEVDLGSRRLHPTQKPVELLRELVQISTQPNDLVFDPFAGSGSTLVASSQLRRRFLGFELSPRFHQIALQRLLDEGKEAPYGK